MTEIVVHAVNQEHRHVARRLARPIQRTLHRERVELHVDGARLSGHPGTRPVSTSSRQAASSRTVRVMGGLYFTVAGSRFAGFAVTMRVSESKEVAMKTILAALLLLSAPAALSPSLAQSPPAAPMRLAIAGLVHGHVSGFLRAAQARTDVEIVGVFDADAALLEKYAAQFKLPKSVLFGDLAAMLDRTKPEAVASFTNTLDHPLVVEAAAPRHVHVMMEKPLAVSTAAAQRIRRAAESGKIQVFVNYETTWYPSHGAMWNLMKERKAAGEIRKMVAMDGHSGPKAINVQPEFLAWLSDPVRNGGGALFDLWRWRAFGPGLAKRVVNDSFSRPAALE